MRAPDAPFVKECCLADDWVPGQGSGPWERGWALGEGGLQFPQPWASSLIPGLALRARLSPSNSFFILGLQGLVRLPAHSAGSVGRLRPKQELMVLEHVSVPSFYPYYVLLEPKGFLLPSVIFKVGPPPPFPCPGS